MEWIRVKDKLPDERELVLACYRSKIDGTPCIGISYCEWASDYKSYYWNWEYGEVTHWMPLPKTPEE